MPGIQAKNKNPKQHAGNHPKTVGNSFKLTPTCKLRTTSLLLTQVGREVLESCYTLGGLLPTQELKQSLLDEEIKLSTNIRLCVIIPASLIRVLSCVLLVIRAKLQTSQSVKLTGAWHSCIAGFPSLRSVVVVLLVTLLRPRFCALFVWFAVVFCVFCMGRYAHLTGMCISIRRKVYGCAHCAQSLIVAVIETWGQDMVQACDADLTKV